MNICSSCNENISISEILEMLYDLTGMRVTVYNTSFRSIISYPGYQITYCKELLPCGLPASG